MVLPPVTLDAYEVVDQVIQVLPRDPGQEGCDIEDPPRRYLWSLTASDGIAMGPWSRGA